MSDHPSPDDEPTQILPPAVAPRGLDGRGPSSVVPASYPEDYGIPPRPEPVRRSRALTVAVWVAAGLVLVMLVSVAGALLSRPGTVPPAPSAPPASDPDASVIAPPPPAPSQSAAAPQVRITLFSAPAAVVCVDEVTPMEVTLTWESVDATRAWIGVGTQDAQQQPYQEVPVQGSLAVPFPCSLAAQEYTVTVAGADGATLSSTLTVARTLAVEPPPVTPEP